MIRILRDTIQPSISSNNNRLVQEQVFGLVVRTLLGTLSSYFGVPEFKTWLYFRFWVSAGVYPEQVMAQVLDLCYPHGKLGVSS